MQSSTIDKYLIRFNMGINLRKLGEYEASAEKLR